jgi:hypothetical protein
MKWSPKTVVIALIASSGLAIDVSASGVIHGKLFFFPGTEVTVTLYETS